MSGRSANDPRDQRQEVADLLPMVRRIVYARAGDAPAADDLVQEVLVKVLEALDRIGPGLLEPYTITTATNVIANHWRIEDRHRRHRHRLVDVAPTDDPGDDVLQWESGSALATALEQLSDRDREQLLEHDLEGTKLAPIAAAAGSTPGAVAAQLSRARARLRVEYLIALDGRPPPTDRCRPVLHALSAGVRRRHEDLDVARHLLECDYCAELSTSLARPRPHEGEVRVAIEGDPDIVRARQAARELAATIGFSPTDQTLIATAVSEMARNVVKFAGRGEVVVARINGDRDGVRVVARDAGPGIADVEEALRDGYSTYGGLGLGLPGARRIMDEFEIESLPGRGTIVAVTKWMKESPR